MRGWAYSNYRPELFNINWRKDGEKSQMERLFYKLLSYLLNNLIFSIFSKEKRDWELMTLLSSELKNLGPYHPVNPVSCCRVTFWQSTTSTLSQGMQVPNRLLKAQFVKICMGIYCEINKTIKLHVNNSFSSVIWCENYNFAVSSCFSIKHKTSVFIC